MVLASLLGLFLLLALSSLLVTPPLEHLSEHSSLARLGRLLGGLRLRNGDLPEDADQHKDPCPPGDAGVRPEQLAGDVVGVADDLVHRRPPVQLGNMTAPSDSRTAPRIGRSPARLSGSPTFSDAPNA